MKLLTPSQLAATRLKLQTIKGLIKQRESGGGNAASRASVRSLSSMARQLREEILYTEAKGRETSKV